MLLFRLLQLIFKGVVLVAHGFHAHLHCFLLAPSHLDWIDATKDQHCGVGYTEWPTSKRPADAGLVDSYRVAHPDPVSQPGITWSPIYLENNGRKEPMDRIDFVYHEGKKLVVKSSKALVVWKPTAQPNHADNEWTSGHKAVLTVYKIMA